MSDFFKKAAGLIFNVEDDNKDPDPQKVPANAAAPAAKPSSAVPAAPVTEGPVYEKFKAYFKDLYDKANLPGPDFYEFSNMTEAMGNVIPDDVKYPSVFAGFGGALTKDKLLTSAGQYLDIIQKDMMDFENSWQSAVKNKVHDRRSQVENKMQEIRKMQEQIARLNNEIIELNKLSQDEEARLEAEKYAYQQQSGILQEKIKTGVEKINRFIR